MGAETEKETALIFTYGTLKQGFSNHGLLQDMIAAGDASFVGRYRTRQNLPLVCGPYRVPFLLNLPNRGRTVRGELYAVSPRALAKMDELEGLTIGHYERLPIELVPHDDNDDDDVDDRIVINAAAYYAHRSYAEAMWKRSGEEGYECYSPKVAGGYVKRKDRPQNLSFMDQIRLFLSSSSSDCPNSDPIIG